MGTSQISPHPGFLLTGEFLEGLPCQAADPQSAVVCHDETSLGLNWLHLQPVSIDPHLPVFWSRSPSVKTRLKLQAIWLPGL